jgi:hypothetical protein
MSMPASSSVMSGLSAIPRSAAAMVVGRMAAITRRVASTMEL